MNINHQTKLCAIIGYPLTHTLSPAIHNAAARHYKLNAVFLAFPTKDPGVAVQAMRSLGWRELTVTMPYKEAVIPYLDELDPEAKELQNVNTIINQDNHLVGYNTDIVGIERSLRGLRLKGRTVVLLGAGGAAKTAAYAVAKRGGELVIFNREVAVAKVIGRKYNGTVYRMAELETRLPKIDPYLIINATPVGMKDLKDQTLIPKRLLSPAMNIFDLIYNPAKTRLLKDAAAIGAKWQNGRTMFLGQGARQFELWSGRPAPWSTIERVFDQEIKRT